MKHGGDLTDAIAHYGGPPESWLDLSTGINPWPRPIPVLPDAAWQRLPTRADEAALIAAARLQVESLTGRALVTQTWRLTICSKGRLVVLPVIPAIALVEAPDGAVLQGDAVLLAELVLRSGNQNWVCTHVLLLISSPP